jgi:ribosomal protein L29
MDYLNIKTGELRSLDAAGLRTAENDIRKEMANLRMDIYSASALSSGKNKKLKKSLARVLTVKSELLRQASN